MRRFYYKLKTYLLHKKFKKEKEFFHECPLLNILQGELLIKKQLYKNSHEFYVQNISSPEMAMSLELVAFLAVLIEKQKPLKILDLGSGFSTFLFNSIHNHVLSVDDNKDWLKKTENYLLANNCKNYQLLGIEDFEKLNEKFDFVFVDLNFVEERIKHTQKVLSLLNSNAIVVFDDVHKDHYLQGLSKMLQMENCYLLNSITKDKFSRFSLLYKNA